MKSYYQILSILILITACFATMRPGQGIHDHLATMEREDLESWALTAERHHRKITKTEGLIGGLHDFIKTQSREDLIRYINKEVMEHPEMNSVSFFKTQLETLKANSMKMGGLHDYIFTVPREKLVSWAMAAEKYARDVKKDTTQGGLHDFIFRLTDQEVAQYILKLAKTYPELDSGVKLDELVASSKTATEATTEEKSINLGGGLHDFIFKLPKDKLISWALATEKYIRSHSEVPILGGIHDYVYTLSEQQIAEYVLQMAGKYPELNSREKLDEISTIETVPLIGAGSGIHDYLATMEREDLEKWALASERHHRKITKTEGLLGGLHDFIGTLSREEIVRYINKKVMEHPEMNSVEFFKSQITEEAPLNVHNSGGLHDYIFRLPREKLVTWALAAEKYSRRLSKVPIYGGLHDYIFRLSEQEISEYILKMVAKYPELNSSEKLDEISAPAANETIEVKMGGGIHDYLPSMEIEELQQWALKAEKQHRKITKTENIIGGMHDNIKNLSREALIRYITKEVVDHPEINNVKFFKNQEETPIEVQKIGGLHDFIFRLPRDTLVTWALSTEKYVRGKDSTSKGGLHDYIFKLSDQEIAEYILKWAKTYPELDSREKLEEISASSEIPTATSQYPHKCDPNNRPTFCTKEYVGVCGWYGKNVMCIRAPCAITSATICSACSNENVEYVTLGQCPQK
jgi:predicted RNA-binding protein YlqC (UPF0109 family)